MVIKSRTKKVRLTAFEKRLVEFLEGKPRPRLQLSPSEKRLAKILSGKAKIQKTRKKT